MAWRAVVLEVDAGHVERLSDALLEAGALSVDISDATAGTPQEEALFGEPGAPHPPTWGRSRLTALLRSDTDVPSVVAAALRAAGLPPTVAYRVERVAERDWVRASQAQFPPTRISPRLWIVPTWRAPPDPHAINIVLDPGLAFGTGTHPTTRLCLRWLEANVRGGETVLDFGCGSGILAIAAMKLGAGKACGVDIDEQALLAAQNNAMQNRVDVEFVAAAGRRRGPAELVVANILANPLIVLAPLLASMTAGGGRIALSGILTEQAGEVQAAYRKWFDISAGESEEGWTLVSGVRK